MTRPSKQGHLEAGIEPKSSVGSAFRARPLGKLHTIPETAEILQISTRTVQRLIASGKLRAHRLGRLVRITDADIAALLDATRSV
jgi:excisionase family DNA binding protein